LRFYPVIRSKGLRTAKEILSQDSRYPGWVLNPRPQEYEPGMLTNLPLRSVTCFFDN
jgi:hypothetical protein